MKPHLDLSTIPLAHFATPATKTLNMQRIADRTSHDALLMNASPISMRWASTCGDQAAAAAVLLHGAGRDRACEATA